MKTITFQNDKVLTLISEQPVKGDQAPDFSLTDSSLNKKTLKDFKGLKIISVFPSIDTGVCEKQTITFLEELKQVNVNLISVSVDLPFALKRWCVSKNFENAIALSDYYDNNFGKSYGVLINELHLLARSLFIIDKDNKIIHTQISEELSKPLDLEEAIKIVKDNV